MKGTSDKQISIVLVIFAILKYYLWVPADLEVLGDPLEEDEVEREVGASK